MLKIERINDKNVSKARNSKTTHLQCAHVMWPLENPSKCCHRVHIPIRQRGQTKFEPTKVSQTRKIETAHLAHAHAAQPHRSPPKWSCKVFGPRHRHGWLKIGPASIGQKCKEWNAHLGLCKPTKPLPRNPDNPTRSTSIGGLQYSLQNLKNDLQNVSHDDHKSIASDTHLSASRSRTRNEFSANT